MIEIMFCRLLILLLASAHFALSWLGTADPVTDSHNPAPTVDLGYSRYRPTAVNITGQYYNFSNIRYAAAPVGPLRWRAPQAPPKDHTSKSVNDGSFGHICPQAPPKWFSQAQRALGNLSAFIAPGVSSQTENEDCLFLDVFAPIKLFPRRGSKPKLAPVLFNIHTGGFFIGEKRVPYPPNGLLTAGNNDFIYVSIGYRVRHLCAHDVVMNFKIFSLVRLVSFPIWSHRPSIRHLPMLDSSTSALL